MEALNKLFRLQNRKKKYLTEPYWIKGRFMERPYFSSWEMLGVGPLLLKKTFSAMAVQKDVRTLSNFFHVVKNLVKESKNVLTLVRSAIALIITFQPDIIKTYANKPGFS